MATRDNIKIGVVDAYISYDGVSEYYLGQTLGGAELTYEPEYVDLMVDKYSSPLDKALSGESLKIKLMLAEITKENQEKAIAPSDFDENAGDSKVQIGRDTGFLLSDTEGLLRLHPTENDVSNTNDDIYIYRAVSAETVTLAFKKDDQRVLEITFEALADETKSNGNRLGRIGNEAIS